MLLYGRLKMFQCISLLLLLCQISYSTAQEEFSATMVYKLLSLRIDNIVHETKNLKSELAETKAVVERIEEKIELIDANVTFIASKTNGKEHSKSLLNEIVKSVHDASVSERERTLQTQATVLRKMLVDEKSHMRKTVQMFENRLKTFELDIKKQLILTNDSFETAFDILNRSTADSLMSVENKVQRIDDQTRDIIQEMNENFESKLNDSETRTELFLSTINSTLQSTRSGLDERINSTLLSISPKEDRKVAFSAKMVKKRSSFRRTEKLVFDTVLYSYGGGYSSSTGIFTAPKSGTYLFTFNVQTPVDQEAHVVLKHEGTSLTQAIVQSSTPNLTGGNTGIAYVEAGQKVWVETYNLHSYYYIWPYRTTFNGILID